MVWYISKALGLQSGSQVVCNEVLKKGTLSGSLQVKALSRSSARRAGGGCVHWHNTGTSANRECRGQPVDCNGFLERLAN